MDKNSQNLILLILAGLLVYFFLKQKGIILGSTYSNKEEWEIIRDENLWLGRDKARRTH